MIGYLGVGREKIADSEIVNIALSRQPGKILQFLQGMVFLVFGCLLYLYQFRIIHNHSFTPLKAYPGFGMQADVYLTPMIHLPIPDPTRET